MEVCRQGDDETRPFIICREKKILLSENIIKFNLVFSCCCYYKVVKKINFYENCNKVSILENVIFPAYFNDGTNYTTKYNNKSFLSHNSREMQF